MLKIQWCLGLFARVPDGTGHKYVKDLLSKVIIQTDKLQCLGPLPCTSMDAIIISVTAIGAPEEAQRQVLSSCNVWCCTWKYCQALGCAFRQWWWQCLADVTVFMPLASLSFGVLQLWELKCGCPKRESSERWVELESPQNRVWANARKSPEECCRTEPSKAVLSPNLL